MADKKKDPVLDASKKGDREDQIGAIFEGAKKKYGSNPMIGAYERDALIVPRVSTGLYGLDVKTNGGLPLGRISMLYGEAKSSKTSTYLRALGNAQRLCGNCYQPGEFGDGTINLPDAKTGKLRKVKTQVIKKCPCGKPKDFISLWIDAEHVWLPEWSERLGVWSEKVILMRPSYGEQAYDIVVAMVERGAVDCIVIDSLAALSAADEVTSSMDQALQGVAARMNNKFFRKVTSSMNQSFQDGNMATTVWLINQYREKIGVMFGDPRVVTGGKGQKFATTLEVEMRPGKEDRDATTDELFTVEFHYLVKKNKVGVGGGRGSFKMCAYETSLFKVGDVMEHDMVIDNAVDMGLIEKPNLTMYNYKGDKFRGKSGMIRHLCENPYEYDELKDKMKRIKLGIVADEED